MKPEKTKAKEDFLQAIKDAYPSLSVILRAYENLTPEDNDETSAGFPFGMSYDEWLMEYRDWAEEVHKRFFPDRFEYWPTLCVGDLKNIIRDLPDETQIVVAKRGQPGWLNINMIQYPNEDEGMFTLTLHTKDNFDTTQF